MGSCATVTSRRVFLKWSLIGLATAAFLAWIQSRAVGGVAGMLQVGEASSLRPLIEAQLGEIPLSPNRGHDGQIFYAIGLDLDGDEVGPLLDHAAYRYRRILLPLIASVFGLLDGWALLWSQLAVGVVSFAVASGLVATFAYQAGRSQLLALSVILNPGMWLSVQILTADALSVATMLIGLYFLQQTTLSGGVFSLSVLAKDVSLATPLPLGISRHNWKVAVLPTAVIAAWMTWLSIQLGDGFAARGNLDWPFAGMITGAANWTHMESKEWVFLVFALLSVAVGIYFGFRRTWLRWPIVAWTALAILSSNWVWDFGNNAARAFAPLVVLVALAACQRGANDGSRPDVRSVAA